ncbi:DUF2334 domain-containing protein [Candidatus Aminicenantes bacterium AC-335-K20]|jgi:hypothetical protein|nr:DUF2334 domain-containing protein [SCandidatus Aminicenantes bacterium Aminicenantia_JdfR_composite]MCP2596719.1 DUF2334 domain-containing protein [Candidatus Aminicenantes bacterium AC-335-G13]MCP2605967.1 DUF2334 domain-containing protein [Candidatus Aminicenantes bacterium AC-708-I09]MCP2618509.1 DUF2334 domain-containing protein [Candidatus Aminicenantes bacterium AC-335-A11]MCP2619287.1 DUF2334 domain-containing protein [Candidatus Aminicenantes bacterium AC-335-K20]MCP2620411.1 DUF233
MGKSPKEKKQLIVSIHDVCPYYFRETKDIVLILENIGISKICLKVIPNYFGEWNILKHENFLKWLIERDNKGDEIIQHGYTHKNWKRKGIMDSIHSEFSSLNYNEAKESIEKGKRIFEEAGIICRGFTSPTWKQNKKVIKAITDCGFDYFTTLLWVRETREKKKRFIPAFGFHGINSFLEYGAMIGNAISTKIIFPVQSCNRIVLHPQNIYNNRAFSFTIKVLNELVKGRELITYSELIKDIK